MQPLVWIVGQWQHEDFREAVAFLTQSADGARFASPTAALEPSGTYTGLPQAIVVLQSRPGEVARADVERLHAATPLARLIVLTGPWCEGEARSGRPWPGVARVAWRSWRSRLARELGWGASGGASDSRLPRTATDAERIERSVLETGLRRFDGPVDVYTDSPTMLEGLAGSLEPLGLAAVWRNVNEERPVSRAVPALLDGWENVPQACPPNSALLLSFPRPGDVARADQLGVATILPQPMLLAELAETLVRLGVDRIAGREVA